MQNSCCCVYRGFKNKKKICQAVERCPGKAMQLYLAVKPRWQHSGKGKGQRFLASPGELFICSQHRGFPLWLHARNFLCGARMHLNITHVPCFRLTGALAMVQGTRSISASPCASYSTEYQQRVKMLLSHLLTKPTQTKKGAGCGQALASRSSNRYQATILQHSKF